jgi:transcriptional regulator with XRE-family HTH domain
MSTTTILTLTEIRKKAGLSLRQAADRLAEYLGELERSHVSILNIERYGTQKYSVICGLADIYGVPVKYIVDAVSILPTHSQSKR